MVSDIEHGKIAGIGLDIIRVERIQHVYDRFGDKFLRRILGLEEVDIFHRRFNRDPRRGIRFLATRFAAKEAFSKAIGLGMHTPMAWSRMQTLNAPGGRPVVRLVEPLATWIVDRYGEGRDCLMEGVRSI